MDTQPLELHRGEPETPVSYFYNLPFSFPFYGSEYNLIRIRYDGFIDFGTFSGLPYVNSALKTCGQIALSPLFGMT